MNRIFLVKVRQFSKALVIGSALSLGMFICVSVNTTTAEAITSGYVDKGDKKGYWIRGKKDGNVYSKYKNYKMEDRASVVNGAGDTDTSGWKSPDTYGVAKRDWTFWGTNKTYYNYK
ncbi:hypothetical protein [Pontibacillus litoralis]|uniref:Bacteriocin n=1 Tax=Pontibacillus litoralis JSM 072002 TaxID=1385512 RepID=A0A0A5G2I3_9BACI|nr:hypothetical protein [Pontibacillus litoralis]KGX87306.1 bacteriocin [Pontibacillus litoralis JSM 072002]